jgi:hypothetical protein
MGPVNNTKIGVTVTELGVWTMLDLIGTYAIMAKIYMERPYPVTSCNSASLTLNCSKAHSRTRFSPNMGHILIFFNFSCEHSFE